MRTAACSCLVATAVAVAVAWAAGADATSVDVATTEGVVHGATEGSVNVWRSIPYAAPPTGNNRLRAPQPKAAWQGTYDANGASWGCPQIKIDGNLMLVRVAGR